MTGNALVPTDVLAILEQEVFIGMAIVIHDVGVATILQGLHALESWSRSALLQRLKPATQRS